ncbi:unannotated protein [freshwater metagenome]|uniref:Unannotated protein n=1 Tax=freshwater metagenome TaxID=449393 RepID=A0A6J6YAH3_9ZZZZ
MTGVGDAGLIRATPPTVNVRGVGRAKDLDNADSTFPARGGTGVLRSRVRSMTRSCRAEATPARSRRSVGTRVTSTTRNGSATGSPEPMVSSEIPTPLRPSYENRFPVLSPSTMISMDRNFLDGKLIRCPPDVLEESSNTRFISPLPSKRIFTLVIHLLRGPVSG